MSAAKNYNNSKQTYFNMKIEKIFFWGTKICFKTAFILVHIVRG